MKSIPKHTLDYIDSWLGLRYKWENIPGYAVAIAKDGELLFNETYGLANTKSKTKLTTDHIFKIASHSKTFTATAIMQLQEQHKLRIDDLVVMYLPWLQKHTDKRWGEVTIRQLLSHSAGVVRDGLDSNYWQLGRDFPNSQQLRNAIMETDLILEPNTQLKYSNYGYSLLGEVVEKASGMPYNDYVQEHIIEPLGLKDTYPELGEDIKEKLTTGYSRPNLQKERLAFPHVTTNAMSPATGFCSTAADLITFFSSQLVGSGKLLSDVSKKEMQRVQWKTSRNNGSYGLGLDIEKVGDRRVFGHSGGFPGYVSRSFVDPKDGIAVVVLVNCHAGWASLIAKTIYKLLDEFGDEPPKKELLKYEGRFNGLHGAMDVVAHAGGVRAIYPNSWFPLDEVDKLEVVDRDTLKVVETSDFANPGELIHYFRKKNGTIEHIVDTGGMRLPTEDGDLIKTWK